jgi:hypothetical protein
MTNEFPSRDLTHNLTRQYGRNGTLNVIGRGNEHVVFRVGIPQDNPAIDVVESSFVLKVSGLAMTEAHSTPVLPFVGPFSKKVTRTDLFSEVTQRKERYKRLKRYFSDHVLEEDSYIQRLLLTRYEVSQFLPRGEIVRDRDDGPFLVDVFVRAQDIVPELDPTIPDENKRTTAILVFPYAERKIIQPQTYEEANNRWILLQDQSAPFNDRDEKVINDVQQSESLAYMLQAARGKKGKGLQEALKDFVTSTIGYTNETREFLALRGKNNVLFIEDDQWDYKLIDALNPRSTPMLDYLIYALNSINSGHPLKELEQVALHNGLGHVRSINALAHALGLRERIDVQVDSFNPSHWQPIYDLLHNDISFWARVSESQS